MYKKSKSNFTKEEYKAIRNFQTMSAERNSHFYPQKELLQIGKNSFLKLKRSLS